MADPMAVDPEALLAAAAAIEEQTETMAAAHASCDAAVRSALDGWIGQSRRALDELSGTFAADTAALAARLRDYAAGLRFSAASFTEMDRLHARMLGD